MNKSKRSMWSLAMAGLCTLSCFLSTGCQGYYGGQTLPSPYYIQDDVQYHAPGPEMKLAREAAAQKEYNAARAPGGQ